MKKIVLISALLALAIGFSSSNPYENNSPPDLNGSFQISIMGIAGYYPSDWTTNWEVCFCTEWEENGEEMSYVYCVPASYNQSVYIKSATVNGIYYTLIGRLKHNGEYVSKETTIGYGYLQEGVPIVSTITWAQDN